MIDQPKTTTQFPAKYWLPIVSWPLLAVLCLTFFVPHNPRVFHIAHMLSNEIYNSYIAVTVLIIVYLSRRRKTPLLAWWPFDASISSFLFVMGLKYAVNMPRPSGGPLGFPSGHTTYSYLLAWLMLETSPRLGVPWVIVAMLIGWSRVEVGAHFPYQVITGAPLGMLIGYWVTHQPGGIILPRLVNKVRRTKT